MKDNKKYGTYQAFLHGISQAKACGRKCFVDKFFSHVEQKDVDFIVDSLKNDGFEVECWKDKFNYTRIIVRWIV